MRGLSSPSVGVSGASAVSVLARLVGQLQLVQDDVAPVNVVATKKPRITKKEKARRLAAKKAAKEAAQEAAAKAKSARRRIPRAEKLPRAAAKRAVRTAPVDTTPLFTALYGNSSFAFGGASGGFGASLMPSAPVAAPVATPTPAQRLAQGDIAGLSDTELRAAVQGLDVKVASAEGLLRNLKTLSLVDNGLATVGSVLLAKEPAEIGTLLLDNKLSAFAAADPVTTWKLMERLLKDKDAYEPIHVAFVTNPAHQVLTELLETVPQLYLMLLPGLHLEQALIDVPDLELFRRWDSYDQQQVDKVCALNNCSEKVNPLVDFESVANTVDRINCFFEFMPREDRYIDCLQTALRYVEALANGDPEALSKLIVPVNY